ncbi:hypothetical protein BJ170DRAFT_315774 [Xylariales sp. AK1849]|nr:hypothetical protein BJ170DRAFT_315774 [Xylariales sp. AK1849]
MSYSNHRSGPLGLPSLDGIVKSAVRGVAGGIGLASESIHARREKKKAKTQQGDSDTATEFGKARDEHHSTTELDATEEFWELDGVQTELLAATQSPLSESTSPPSQHQTEGELAAAFLEHQKSLVSPQTAVSPTASRLELPVILPQRRPKDRTRGFLRAYAPDLMSVNIDEGTWLSFLDSFEKSSAASPWLDAINLAGFAGMMLPHGISMLVSLALQQGVKVAKDLQSRQRTNKFLLQINDEFFRPKGLYCLVMTWRPDSGDLHERVDMTTTVTSAMSSYNAGVFSKFKNSSGKTYGDFDFPEAAPLVFPTLDVLGTAQGEEAAKLKDKLKKKKVFIDNYYDRREQAKYAGKNPDSLLANQTQKPEFSSRYADPNHPANSGSLIALVTGGYVNPPPLGGGYLNDQSGAGFGGRRGGGLGGGFGGDRGFGLRGNVGFGGARGLGLGSNVAGSGRGFGFGNAASGTQQGSPTGNRRQAQEGHRGGLAAQSSGIAGFGGLRGGLGGPPVLLKKLMKKDVLYLMVVNMPSQQELDGAAAAISNLQNQSR